MSAYQLIAPAFELAANTTPATNIITSSYIASGGGNLGGGITPLFLKVTNTSTTVSVFFDAKPTALTVATGGTVIGPGLTEYIQVLNTGPFANVHVASSAASAVAVYVTPVTVVK